MTTDSDRCEVALSGRHMYNPKRVKMGDKFVDEFRCVCGRRGSDPNGLAATEAERKRQAAFSAGLLKGEGGGVPMKPWPTDTVKATMAPWPKK